MGGGGKHTKKIKISPSSDKKKVIQIKVKGLNKMSAERNPQLTRTNKETRKKSHTPRKKGGENDWG